MLLIPYEMNTNYFLFVRDFNGGQKDSLIRVWSILMNTHNVSFYGEILENHPQTSGTDMVGTWW